MVTVATVLAGLISAGVVVMGASAFWAPRAAAGFGIPDTPVEDRTFRAWLAVKAVRDLGAGLLIAALVIGATPQLLGWGVLAATTIPLGDAVIVRRSGGPRAAAYGVHGVTAAVMLATGVVLLMA